MLSSVDVHWVAMCKTGNPLYLVAGPFGLWGQAEAAMDEMEDPGGACYLEVVSSKMIVKSN
jgi:hypothetical protein